MYGCNIYTSTNNEVTRIKLSTMDCEKAYDSLTQDIIWAITENYSTLT